MSSFGQKVRTFREKKGISLNEFAKRLEVSAGYLSNLETGKTDTIKLCVLEQLQKELFVTPALESESDHPYQIRLERLQAMLMKSNQKNPSFTDHFLTQLEKSLELLIEA